MRILNLDFGLEWRGGQRQSLALHEGLRAGGQHSTLLVITGSQLAARASSSGIEGVVSLSSNPLVRIGELRRCIHEMAPEIVHFHDSLALSWIRLLPSKHAYYVATRRVSYPIKWTSRFWKYSPVDAHVGVSSEITQYLKKYFKFVVCIPSCIDLSRFSGSPEATRAVAGEDSTKDGRFRILFVGALTRQKGVEILLDAVANLQSRYSTFVVDIVGDGSLRTRLEAKTRDLGIQDRVKFHEAQSKVEAFYANSDVVVVPSVDGEGSNGVIKEALAAAKLVVASDLTANQDLFQNEVSGLFFQSKNTQDLSDKLFQIATHKIQLSPAAIRAQAMQFSPENMVKSYKRLYQDLFSAKSTP